MGMETALTTPAHRKNSTIVESRLQGSSTLPEVEVAALNGKDQTGQAAAASYMSCTK